MAIPIINTWGSYFTGDGNEGLGSSYERIILNRKIIDLLHEYRIGKKILEVPVFGFTGMSGINSMGLSQSGYSVTLVDHDANRLEKIKALWHQTGADADFHSVNNYERLPFENKEFDFSWNFSALWFVSDIELFLKELCRISRSAILLCVPNRTGLGYIIQKAQSGKSFHQQVTERNIIPRHFTGCMRRNGWSLKKTGYIDCPPWPDIGMAKEDFLKRFGITVSTTVPYYSIIDYYSGRNPDFKNEMLKHSWFERLAPPVIKMFWAHHRFFLFLPASDE